MRRLSRFSVSVTLSPPTSDTDRGPALGAAAAPAGPGFQRPSSEAELRGPLAGSLALSTVYLLVKSGHEP